ncbi:MAG: hypothetical protein L3J21_07810 [Devosiaceae bacterium]|nr:hypothetical protein [Devosiaceae bacterium]
MNKSVVISALMMTAFVTPGFAASDGTTPLMFEGDCLSVVEKIDERLADETLAVSDETKLQIMALRDQGALEQADGNDAACTTTLTLAIQLLNSEG